MVLHSLRPDLKIEWVDEYLMPGIQRMNYHPTPQEKIEYFDLAMNDNYKEIRRRINETRSRTDNNSRDTEGI